MRRKEKNGKNGNKGKRKERGKEGIGRMTIGGESERMEERQ